jgi:hypothetical protein
MWIILIPTPRWLSLIPTPRWLGLIPTPTRGPACHSSTRVPTKFVVLSWIRRNTTANIRLRPHLKLQTLGTCYWEGQTNCPAHAYKLFNVVIRPAWKIFVATGLGLFWSQVKSFGVKSHSWIYDVLPFDSWRLNLEFMTLHFRLWRLAHSFMAFDFKTVHGQPCKNLALQCDGHPQPWIICDVTANFCC